LINVTLAETFNKIISTMAFSQSSLRRDIDQRIFLKKEYFRVVPLQRMYSTPNYSICKFFEGAHHINNHTLKTSSW
jgi:hypothetical protein